MSIYTKKGDKGETGLFSSDKDKKIRVSKSSQIIKTIGAIDELNSYLGVISSELKNQKLKFKNTIQKSKIEGIQSDLLTIGSIIAGSKLELKSKRVEELEIGIDKMDKELPPLKNFILPGGTKVAASLQFARSLVRRAEREFVALSRISNIKYQISISKYLNRLSDYIYTLARYENFKNGFEDVIWKK